MRIRTIVSRSLFHYRKVHCLVVLGAALSAGVVTGAIVVGDSVRGSLLRMARERLGRTTHAMVGGDRLFRAELAEEVTEAPAAAVLIARGTVASDSGDYSVPGIQAVGIDSNFLSLVPGETAVSPPQGDDILLNERLAAALAVSPGDEIVLRVERAGILPRDTMLSSDERPSVPLRLTVRDVLPSASLGNFSLNANQVPPHNLFLARDRLADALDLAGRANLVLVAAGDTSTNTTDKLQESLAGSCRPVDLGIVFESLPGGKGIDLRSQRVFLDPPVASAALRTPGSRGILGYFVNELRHGTNATPYSFVAALDNYPPVPSDLADNEVIINEWLAKDLAVNKGGRLEMTYFVLTESRALAETSAVFRVRSVLPILGPASDKTLMPPLPGISEADTCRNWDPGIPIDLDLVRDKDKDYWEEYRGTPKAFVSLVTGQKLWENRFGELTAVRLPPTTDTNTLISAIMRSIDPASLGMVFVPVRDRAMQAASQGVDFGQLFAGLSMFIIAAALCLTGLLFLFGIESRQREIGTMRALGFTPGRTRLVLVLEAGVLALLGAVLGAAVGAGYNKAAILGLNTIWSGAVNQGRLQARLATGALATGTLVSTALAVVTMAVAVWKFARRTPIQLLQRGTCSHPLDGQRHQRRYLVAGGACLAGAMVLVILGGADNPGAFFGAGVLLLAGGLSLFRWFLAARAGTVAAGGLLRLGVRSAARRPGRSVSVAGMLACGVFVVIAVAANRKDPLAGIGRPDSGTGGFRLYGELTAPIMHDLDTEAGRKEAGLSGKGLENARYLQMRVRDGDDASCLNLSRTSSPRLLGVDYRKLAARRAFSFMSGSAAGADSPWEILRQQPGDDTIPAVADHNVILWGLGKKPGDVLTIMDEFGQPLKLQLIAGLRPSILQGSLLIAEQVFLRRFPSVSGYRLLLVDTPSADGAKVSSALSRALRDHGPVFTPAAQRLADFSRVETTYLDIFMSLGGLGILLGTCGLAAVVLRNVLERRSELALLRALGFTRSELIGALVAEHGLLTVCGTACGTLAAALAVLPSIIQTPGSIPVVLLVALVVSIAAGGIVWSAVGAHIALKDELLPALRRE